MSRLCRSRYVSGLGTGDALQTAIQGGEINPRAEPIDLLFAQLIQQPCERLLRDLLGQRRVIGKDPVAPILYVSLKRGYAPDRDFLFILIFASSFHSLQCELLIHARRNQVLFALPLYA